MNCTLHVNAHLKLKVKNASDVPHPTRALSCQTIDISLAAHAATDVTATCTTQPAVLYTSTAWDSPRVQPLDTPLHLKAGQGITFTCHYMNNTPDTIGFGLTASTEMCAAMNRYAFPATKLHDVPAMLGATIYSNATPTKVSDTSKSAIPLF